MRDIHHEGFVFAYTLNISGLAHLNITNFIIAGMAASISGVMHAPLTGVFLAAEITGGYVLMVPLMIVSAISYFINKGINKYSIYTRILADEGTLISQQNKDYNVLRKLKLKYLIEKDFVILRPDDTLLSRSNEIIHTQRNVFPVVGQDGELKGIMYTDQLLEYLISDKKEDQQRFIKDISQPASKIINVQTTLYKVMQVMDSMDTRILPVTDENNQYLGFVTKNGIFNKYRHILSRQEGDSI